MSLCSALSENYNGQTNSWDGKQQINNYIKVKNHILGLAFFFYRPNTYQNQNTQTDLSIIQA